MKFTKSLFLYYWRASLRKILDVAVQRCERFQQQASTMETIMVFSNQVKSEHNVAFFKVLIISIKFESKSNIAFSENQMGLYRND